ncbi:hypothetical protein LB503_005565 [Fusarium chuoi]|nr:hypothetical protein LB503_005565 [Fusarium chuoi]
MGCAILETMVAARLDTLPYLTSSNVWLQAGLLADGNEEWEPWNLKILVEPEYLRDQHNTNPHVPGHIILSLNELIHHKKNLAPTGSFGKLIGLCKENFIAMDSLKSATLSPQALGVCIASVTIFELAATEASVSNRRCAISPVVKACMELIMRYFRQQETHYTPSNIGDDFHCAKEAVAKCLHILQESLGEMSQDDVLNDARHISAVPPYFELPPTPSTLLSSKVDISVPGNATHSQPPSGMPFPIDPTLGSNNEDDGLFDSLTTLDSTDWLANPPEFMQHLGMLDDAPSNLEHLFEMGF